MDYRSALRYATAVFEIAQKNESLDEVRNDMQTIEESVAASRELRSLLNSPIVRPEQKIKILREIFGKRMHKETMLFMDLLVKKGRSELLGDVAKEFRRLLDEKRNIVNATITSAIELDKSEKETIQTKLEGLTGKVIHPTFLLDPSLKGGFIARIGDTLLDASLAHQLEVLREQFKHGGSPILN